MHTQIYVLYILEYVSVIVVVGIKNIIYITRIHLRLRKNYEYSDYGTCHLPPSAAYRWPLLPQSAFVPIGEKADADAIFLNDISEINDIPVLRLMTVRRDVCLIFSFVGSFLCCVGCVVWLLHVRFGGCVLCVIALYTNIWICIPKNNDQGIPYKPQCINSISNFYFRILISHP